MKSFHDCVMHVSACSKYIVKVEEIFNVVSFFLYSKDRSRSSTVTDACGGTRSERKNCVRGVSGKRQEGDCEIQTY